MESKEFQRGYLYAQSELAMDNSEQTLGKLMGYTGEAMTFGDYTDYDRGIRAFIAEARTIK